ncbi:MAG: phosphoglucosamine mutase [Holosporales bacterium]|jgi:phosphoglucosamine mutase|nr:phosphoglucosamine mutase [Holosporales bacterium]
MHIREDSSTVSSQKTDIRKESNIFGTDGVRGRANEGYITPDKVTTLAVSVINYYNSTSHVTVNNKFTVVIGKDTRLSGYMLEPALTAGFISAGANVILLGPIPTHGVAFITRSLRADLGVVISASHNPFQDNGIKLFGPQGFKISPTEEIRISNKFHEILRAGSLSNYLVDPGSMGKARRLNDAAGRYVETVKRSFPKDLSLAGMKIVIDAANGAAHRIAPQVFWELGADIIKIGCDPNGININHGCGAIDTNTLRKTVLKSGADIGISLDGDADRVIIVDDLGNVIDGDYIIAAIATDWLETGRLITNKVVATYMSNLGLEEYLDGIGIELIRSDVGDKHVLDQMLKIGCNLGGEKSGHVIPIDYATTGDGLISAMQVLAYLKRRGLRSSQLMNLYQAYPQILKNIKKQIDPTDTRIQSFVKDIENNVLNQRGRIIVRKSGTENITRIMIEAETRTDIDMAITQLEGFLSEI